MLRLPALLLLGAPLLGCASSTPAPAGPHYLALGDSFTAGTGATPAEAYPARLVANWGCPVDLLDLGVDGYTTDNVIWQELPQLPSFAPVFVTLAIGANDIVQKETSATYQSHVHQILATLVAAGVKRIVTIPQPDWSASPTALMFGTPAALHASIVEFNGILQTETEAVHGVYIDLFPLMEEQAAAHMLAADGLHPSAAAYDQWGVALAAQVSAPCADASPGH